MNGRYADRAAPLIRSVRRLREPEIRKRVLMAAMATTLVASVVSLIFGDRRSDLAVVVADVGLMLAALVLIGQSMTPARRASRVPDEALSDYVGTLAHELSSPIVSIGAAAQVLARELDGRTARLKAQMIAEEARQVYALVEDLSDLSALETGRLRMVMRATDLGELVRETVRMIDTGTADHHIQCDIPEERLVVTGDERRLRQVVRNLVINAAKYSPPGTQIEVRCGGTSDRGSAIVQVRDHGPGIPPGERGRLFEKFARLSTAGSVRGSGLGLHLSHAIVGDHGGEIWAEWPASGGTVFSFTVPLSAQASSVSTPREASVT